MEICKGGSYTTVCKDTSWDNKDASVVCSQLGFSPYGMTLQSDLLHGTFIINREILSSFILVIYILVRCSVHTVTNTQLYFDTRGFL